MPTLLIYVIIHPMNGFGSNFAPITLTLLIRSLKYLGIELYLKASIRMLNCSEDWKTTAMILREAISDRVRVSTWIGGYS